MNGEPIAVYHVFDNETYKFVRICGSLGFRDTFGEPAWRRLNELGWMKYGNATLYLYMFGRTDFPEFYYPSYEQSL